MSDTPFAVCAWDSFKIWEDARFSRLEEIAEEHGCKVDELTDADLEEATQYANNYDMTDDNWFLIESLNETLEHIPWIVNIVIEGRRMGWQQRTGYKCVNLYKAQRSADKSALAEEFLNSFLPKTDCTFTIAFYPGRIEVTNSHHDAPTGEFYCITPDVRPFGSWEDASGVIVSRTVINDEQRIHSSLRWEDEDVHGAPYTLGSVPGVRLHKFQFGDKSFTVNEATDIPCYPEPWKEKYAEMYYESVLDAVQKMIEANELPEVKDGVLHLWERVEKMMGEANGKRC